MEKVSSLLGPLQAFPTTSRIKEMLSTTFFARIIFIISSQIFFFVACDLSSNRSTQRSSTGQKSDQHSYSGSVAVKQDSQGRSWYVLLSNNRELHIVPSSKAIEQTLKKASSNLSAQVRIAGNRPPQELSSGITTFEADYAQISEHVLDPLSAQACHQQTLCWCGIITSSMNQLAGVSPYRLDTSEGSFQLDFSSRPELRSELDRRLAADAVNGCVGSSTEAQQGFEGRFIQVTGLYLK